MTLENGKPNGDAAKWRVLMTIAALVAMASMVFGAGMAWGTVAGNSARIDGQDQRMDAIVKENRETYIRKDGKELADILAQLRELSRHVEDMANELRVLRSQR